MFRMRCGNACTKPGDSSRIYPARQTRSTSCSLSAARIAWSCSARFLPFASITLRGKASLAGRFDAWSLGAIGDHHGDFGVGQCAAFDAVGDRDEVGTTAG